MIADLSVGGNTRDIAEEIRRGLKFGSLSPAPQIAAQLWDRSGRRDSMSEILSASGPQRCKISNFQINNSVRRL